MKLMLKGVYLHPSGQMPAYEWNFSDVNPPVHAFATLFLHRTEQALRGETDLDFLKATFNKLLLNFTWWVNRKDRFGKNVFEGGFLGLDNIGVFDRSAPLPTCGQEYRVDYLPAESNTGMFGGNSNWRGPVWMPVNAILIRALLNFYLYYGDNFKIECPTGSGKMMDLFEVSKEIADRLSRIFLRDENGRRPVYGGTEKFQTDPHWRDHILFYEYFHGDNGAGLGANHQTGWTGVVAKFIQLYGLLDPKRFLEAGKAAAFVEGAADARRE
jgi:hypothetical protein